MDREFCPHHGPEHRVSDGEIEWCAVCEEEEKAERPDWRKVCPGLESVYDNLCMLLSGDEADIIMERIASEFEMDRKSRPSSNL